MELEERSSSYKTDKGDGWRTSQCHRRIIIWSSRILPLLLLFTFTLTTIALAPWIMRANPSSSGIGSSSADNPPMQTLSPSPSLSIVRLAFALFPGLALIMFILTKSQRQNSRFMNWWRRRNYVYHALVSNHGEEVSIVSKSSDLIDGDVECPVQPSKSPSLTPSNCNNHQRPTRSTINHPSSPRHADTKRKQVDNSSLPPSSPVSSPVRRSSTTDTAPSTPPPPQSKPKRTIPASPQLERQQQRRLDHRRRLTGASCQNSSYKPQFYKTKDVCSLCWSAASPSDKAQYQQTGYSLCLVQTKGGCSKGSECSALHCSSSNSTTETIHQNSRLCRKCYVNSHTTFGQRTDVYRGNHRKVLT